MRPPIEKLLNVAGPELVTDRLQADRIGAREKAVVEAGKGDLRGAQLLFHPFVAVQADFDRVREIGADLDEGGAPRGVVQIKVIVIDRHGLPGEIERHRFARPASFVCLEGSHLLLRDADDHDTFRGSEFRTVSGDDGVFVLARLELKERHRVLGRIRLDGVHQAVVHRAKQRGRGNRMPQMIAQEVAQAARCLKLGHVALQVDAIEAPHRQCHVIPDNAVDVGRHQTLLGRKVDDGTPREHAGHCIGPNIKRPRSGRDLKVRRSREAPEMLRAS